MSVWRHPKTCAGRRKGAVPSAKLCQSSEAQAVHQESFLRRYFANSVQPLSRNHAHLLEGTVLSDRGVDIVAASSWSNPQGTVSCFGTTVLYTRLMSTKHMGRCVWKQMGRMYWTTHVCFIWLGTPLAQRDNPEEGYLWMGGCLPRRSLQSGGCGVY
jgi:hypothetical protein